MYFKATVSYSAPEEIEIANEDVAKVEEMSKDGKMNFYKPVKESYLVNADSVTYAEAKILKELPDNYKNKDVKGVIPSNVSRVVFSSGELWFLAGVKYEKDITKKGKILYYHEYTMINGDDISNALDNIIENHKGTTLNYKIVSLQESKIIIERGLLTSDTIISG